MFLLEDKTTGYKDQSAQITRINVAKTVVLLEFVEMAENFKIYFIFFVVVPVTRKDMVCV